MTPMFKSALRYVFGLTLLMLAQSSVFAAGTAMLTDKHMGILLGPYLDMLIDEAGDLEFETVQNLPDSGNHKTGEADASASDAAKKWRPITEDNIIGGFTRSVYWVRFSVENPGTDLRSWMLEVNYPLLDHIELYVPDGLGGYVKQIAGDKLPFDQRPVDYKNFVFPLEIAALTAQTYYMRFETNSSMFIELKLWVGKSFAESIDGVLMLNGILYGIVFLASIYCFINAIFLRRRLYFFIALSILNSVGYLMGINGYGFQYVWPDNLWFQEVNVPFFMAACFGFALLYSRDFLELSTTSPRSDKLILNFARTCLILSLSSLIVDYAIVIRIATVFAIVSAFALFWGGLISYIRGKRFARFSLLGWIAVIIGATTFALKSLGLVPANTFTIWSQEFGFAGVSIFLTLALADHFFHAQREHSEQQGQSIIAIKAAEKKYRSLFENAIEGIFQMDTSGRLINVNRAFVNILGHQDISEFMAQQHPPFSLNCLEEKDRNRFLGLLEQDKSAISFQTHIKLPNAEERWITISIQKIHDQDETTSHYEGAMADITEKKKREQAEKQRHMAEASTEAKSLFLANMSHEIRTPMNAIIGFTDLALGQNKNIQIAGYLQKTRMASTNLLGIINDILDFSKIEAGKLEIEHTPFSIKEVFNNLSNIVSANVASKNLILNLEIDKDIPDKLVGDPLRIGQVLLNLTNNAIKFTSEGQVTVALDLIALDKKAMHIELSGRVTDTGIGIPEEKLKTLFSSFTQADESTTRRFGGTGLGLSISKQLIEMMGGNLSVTSVAGKGSTFQFRLACKLQDRRQRNNPRFKVQEGPLKVLVVDDQEESRILMHNALTSLGHKATCVTNSGEAILELKRAQAEEQVYDVFIADWLMPDVDGITCCQLIKDDPDILTPRTILITGYDQDEARTRVEQAGIDAYMLKPVRTEELEGIFRRVFHDRRASDTNADALPAKKSFEGFQVLLVEDVRMNQELAIEILSKRGIQVSVANNGEEGVAAVRQNRFDLVLMDMQMPVMDGCQATRTIRTFEPQLPIIAMTANAMTGDRQKCMTAGMNGYITKPINPSELFTEIGRWCTESPPVTSASVEPAQEGPDKAHASDKQQTASAGEQPEDWTREQNYKGLNARDGLNRCQGNNDLYLRFLKDFTQSYADSARQLDEFCNQNLTEDLQMLAHKIKGLAANLGAEPLAHSAGRLENSGNLAPEELKAGIYQYQQDLAELLESIEQILNSQALQGKPEGKAGEASQETVSQGTGTGMPIPRSDMRAHLEELLSQVKRQKLDAQQMAIDCLSRWPESAHKTNWQAVITSLDNFDFKQAEALIGEIDASIEPGGSEQSA